MKLSDVMSAMQLAHYAEVALIIFLFVFLAVLIHVLRSEHRDRWESARLLPLADESEKPNPTIQGKIDG
jgi:cbb3-type cytochrome oxidase subunit 3